MRELSRLTPPACSSSSLHEEIHRRHTPLLPTATPRCVSATPLHACCWCSNLLRCARLLAMGLPQCTGEGNTPRQLPCSPARVGGPLPNARTWEAQCSLALAPPRDNRSECELGHTFGCAAHSVMWVRGGCRGLFWCNAHATRCGHKRISSMECNCSAPTGARDEAIVSAAGPAAMCPPPEQVFRPEPLVLKLQPTAPSAASWAASGPWQRDDPARFAALRHPGFPRGGCGYSKSAKTSKCANARAEACFAQTLGHAWRPSAARGGRLIYLDLGANTCYNPKPKPKPKAKPKPNPNLDPGPNPNQAPTRLRARSGPSESCTRTARRSPSPRSRQTRPGRLCTSNRAAASTRAATSSWSDPASRRRCSTALQVVRPNTIPPEYLRS